VALQHLSEETVVRVLGFPRLHVLADKLLDFHNEFDVSLDLEFLQIARLHVMRGLVTLHHC
jgi:hypothetical protein